MAQDKFKFTYNGVAGQLDVVQDVATHVEGPASATDNAIAVYDSTTGKLIKNTTAFVQTDGRVTAGADASGSLDLITKQQLDAAIQGVDVKEGARAASTIDLTLSGEQTVDTVALTTGNRVLVKNQSAPAENGVYVVAAGAWARASDSNTAAELNGALVTVAEGGQANTGWYQYQEIVTLGTDPVNFNQFFGAGTYVADGNGIELSGSTFSLELDGATLSKSSSGLKVATGGITSTELGAASVTDTAVATGIDAAKIADGSVSNAEFQFLDGVSSNIQTQLGTFATKELNNLTTTAINADLIFNKSAALVKTTDSASTTTNAVSLTSGDVSSSSTGASGVVTVKSGDKTGTGVQTTGNVVVQSGANAATTDNAGTPSTGTVTLQSGNRTSTNTGPTGAVTITTGTNTTSNSVTGALTLSTGTKTGSNSATGSVSLKSGDSSTNGSGATGNVTVQSGDQTDSINSGGASGNVLIKSGDKAGSSNNSGTLTLNTGNATFSGGAGTSGAILVQTGSSISNVTGIVTLASGDKTGTDTANTGAVTIRTGQTSSSGASITTGALTLQSGLKSTGSGGATGAVTLSSGTYAGTGNGASGTVNITSGANSSSSTGATGAVTVQSGAKTSGTANSGAVTVKSGDSTATSGLVTINSGAGTATSDVAVATGNASAGNSGAISLTTGTATGTRGAVVLNGLNVDVSATDITNIKTTKYNPQSADPGSPSEGQLQYADGTVRTEGMWVYKNGAWEPVGANAGFIATDWTAYTPTFTGFGTPSDVDFKSRRVGDTLQVRGTFTSGTATAVEARLSLPTGLSTTSTLPSISSCGVFYRNSAGGIAGEGGGPVTVSPSLSYVTFSSRNMFSSSNKNWQVAQNGSTNFASGDDVSIEFTVPIDTWAANTVAAVQSINARAHNSATSISGTPATIVWTTEDYDTDSALASGVFTVPSTGKYQVNAALAVSGTFVLNNTSIMELQVNGTTVSNVTRYIAAAVTNESIQLSDTIQVTAGDTVRIQYSTQGTGPAIVSSDTRNFFSISKIGN